VELVTNALAGLKENAMAAAATQLSLLAVLVYVVHRAAKFLLTRGIEPTAPVSSARWDSAFLSSGVISRLSHIAPALTVYYGVTFVDELPEKAIAALQVAASTYMAVAIALAFGGVLSALGDIYHARDPDHARLHPIKSYLQLGKLFIYIVAATLIVAMLFNRDPLLLLSGLGAMTAVVMLVFRDTLLSLVASVQLASLDMLRIGDWIEMPQLDADGHAVDISLHTVKVQNWDNSITTIPTWRLISESFKNWRGMRECGGRRIKRALLLDQNSIRFLDAEDWTRLQRFYLIKDYLMSKRTELDAHNANVVAAGRDTLNIRRITNAGTFRAYVLAYLRAHPSVLQNMDLLVRQLPPGPTGLPIEIYCFTSPAWEEYERVQADIFDHLYAIVSEFDLRVFQQPSGSR
jgi:miniconductance mechanosensitive channel